MNMLLLVKNLFKKLIVKMINLYAKALIKLAQLYITLIEVIIRGSREKGSSSNEKMRRKVYPLWILISDLIRRYDENYWYNEIRNSMYLSPTSKSFDDVQQCKTIVSNITMKNLEQSLASEIIFNGLATVDQFIKRGLVQITDRDSVSYENSVWGDLIKITIPNRLDNQISTIVKAQMIMQERRMTSETYRFITKNIIGSTNINAPVFIIYYDVGLKALFKVNLSYVDLYHLGDGKNATVITNRESEALPIYLFFDNRYEFTIHATTITNKGYRTTLLLSAFDFVPERLNYHRNIKLVAIYQDD